MKAFTSDDIQWLRDHYQQDVAAGRWLSAIIDWEDSLQPTCEWEFLDDITIREAFVVRSIGWIIGISHTALSLAQAISTSKDNKRQVNGVSTIPFRSILGMEVGK